tara:strand:- start:67 stop:495 length:429 start_codon:yes stop_codon:yes gene_type:complete
MQPVGSAKLSVFFWDIYHSTLYSSDGAYTDDQRPLALQITYLRDIHADDLLASTTDEWDKLGIARETYRPWLAQLTSMWPNIKEQDEFLFLINNDHSGAFYVNQKWVGSIADKNFSMSFLRIWLDPNGSYPKLRKQLIGQAK